MNIVVRDNTAANRYEASLGDEIAGFLEYQLGGGRIVFTHTEVNPAHRRQGIGAALAQTAMDDTRANRPGVMVAPQCPFIASWLGDHPDYLGMVSDASPHGLGVAGAACPINQQDSWVEIDKITTIRATHLGQYLRKITTAQFADIERSVIIFLGLAS